VSDENAVRISGMAADTPVLRYTERGTPEAHFSLASRRTCRGADGRPYVRTLFVCVAGWSDAAIAIQGKVKRGRPVTVEGFLSRDDPRTASDKRAQIVVVAERITTDAPGGRLQAPSDKPEACGLKPAARSSPCGETTMLPLDGLAK